MEGEDIEGSDQTNQNGILCMKKILGKYMENQETTY